MKPINEIRALFNVIKTETRRWFNTGARIDEVGQEILDHIEYLEQQGGDSLWENVSGVLSPKNNLVYSFVNALEKPTYLVNVVANSFVADITYEDFPFKCEIAITGVTSANNAEITFSLAQATSGDLAPICVTDTNKVIIYAKRDLGSIVIPLIKMEVVL